MQYPADNDDSSASFQLYASVRQSVQPLNFNYAPSNQQHVQSPLPSQVNSIPVSNDSPQFIFQHGQADHNIRNSEYCLVLVAKPVLNEVSKSMRRLYQQRKGARECYRDKHPDSIKYEPVRPSESLSIIFDNISSEQACVYATMGDNIYRSNCNSLVISRLPEIVYSLTCSNKSNI